VVGGDRPQVCDLLGVEEAADRLVGGEAGRTGDHGDHEQPGQVLGAAVVGRCSASTWGRRDSAKRDQQRSETRACRR